MGLARDGLSRIGMAESHRCLLRQGGQDLCVYEDFAGVYARGGRLCLFSRQ